jgi:hypothetical protein
MPTHPGLLLVVIIWESIHSHHAFQHGPAYKPFIVSALPILAGDLIVANFEVKSHSEVKKALESPCTQISHLAIKKGFVYEFLEAYHTGWKKYVGGEKYNGMWTSYPYEDPYNPFESLN